MKIYETIHFLSKINEEKNTVKCVKKHFKSNENKLKFKVEATDSNTQSMSKIVKFNEVENRISRIGNQQIIVDADVVTLYEPETKRMNEAVKNSPKKYPKGYIIELNFSVLN